MADTENPRCPWEPVLFESVSFEGPSARSLVAAGFYVAIGIACLLAARRSPTPRWHRMAWFVLSCLFVALSVSRLTGAEEILKGGLRHALQDLGQYADRRLLQAIAALVVSLLAVAAFWLGWKRFKHQLNSRRAKTVALALLAGLCMMSLIALRLVSLHSIDFFLFGPLKLNWILDLGSALTVGACALVYVKAAGNDR